MTTELEKCAVCSTKFDPAGEGGIQGYFGMIPVSFCPTCLSCMVSMVEQIQEFDEVE